MVRKKDVFMKKFYILVLLFVIMISTAVQAETSFDEQINLIASNADLWKQDVEYGVWGYVITDLDHNGQLEILSCSVQGTGFYSYIKAYEVNKDGTELNDLMKELTYRTDSSPDIMVSSVPVYFDKESNRYYYIFDDMIRSGMAEYYENKRAVSVVDDLWKEIMLADKATIYTDADHAKVTCSDGNGNEISEARYAEIADIVFSNLESGEACFNWTTTDNDEFSSLSVPQLIENLKSAAQDQCRTY